MNQHTSEYTDTRVHVLRAGRELLLAARGMLTFCQHYLKENNDAQKNAALSRFFCQALCTIDELGRELLSQRSFQDVVAHVVAAIESEMSAQSHRKTEKNNPRAVTKKRQGISGAPKAGMKRKGRKL